MTNRVTQVRWTRHALGEQLKHIKKMLRVMETALNTFDENRIHPASRRVRIAVARIEQSALETIKEKKYAAANPGTETHDEDGVRGQSGTGGED